jgi:hypothetical protein
MKENLNLYDKFKASKVISLNNNATKSKFFGFLSFKRKLLSLPKVQAEEKMTIFSFSALKNFW